MPEYTEGICEDGAAILSVAVQKVGSRKILGMRRFPLALVVGNGEKGTEIEFDDGIIVNIVIS